MPTSFLHGDFQAAVSGQRAVELLLPRIKHFHLHGLENVCAGIRTCDFPGQVAAALSSATA
jgi:hypothetical protein